MTPVPPQRVSNAELGDALAVWQRRGGEASRFHLQEYLGWSKTKADARIKQLLAMGFIEWTTLYDRREAGRAALYRLTDKARQLEG